MRSLRFYVAWSAMSIMIALPAMARPNKQPAQADLSGVFDNLLGFLFILFFLLLCIVIGSMDWHKERHLFGSDAREERERQRWEICRWLLRWELTRPLGVRQARKLAARGHVRAQCYLVHTYSEGKGIQRDQAEATKWRRMAAEQGNINFQLRLGMDYFSADDIEEAVKWLRRAAEQGDAKAQSFLGAIYFKGHGVPEDLKEAKNWLVKAAAAGNAGAQYFLGLAYRDGKGVSKDSSQAARLFRLAATQGDANAQYCLGLCYQVGQGVEEDLTQALDWFVKAAEQGNQWAQYELGLFYRYVDEDLEEAAKWSRKAAEQGNPFAQESLGIAYSDGAGVPKDKVLSYMWLNLASQTVESAQQRREELEATLSPAEIAEAQRLSREWRPNRKLNEETDSQ